MKIQKCLIVHTHTHSLRELEPMGTAGMWLYYLCRGVDDRPVKDKGPPSSIGFQVSSKSSLR
jgi:nucleotidyltransferase/DNA polymerase involved in DNA repair